MKYNIKVEHDKKFAKHFIEKNHYSKMLPQAIKYRFSFYSDWDFMGMAIFSIPANQHAITSEFYDETQKIGIELSRVFTFNKTPKNFESYCLSQSFKYINKHSDYDLIVSYADPAFNHVGYVYQALNGIYLGQTGTEIRYMHNGKLITRRGLGRKKGQTEKDHAQNIIKDGGERIKMPGKHKYIFFICGKKRKKELLLKMKRQPLPYPKSSNS